MEVQLKRPTPGDASPAQSNNQLKDGMQEQHVVMMSCKAKPGKSMGVKDGAVIFIETSQTDINQQWFKVYSGGLKDAEGNPAFALVNRGTRQAIQNPEEAEQPVRLVPYNSNKLDADIFWTNKDAKDSLKIIRECKLVLEAAAHQGNAQIVASKDNGGRDSQLWSIQRKTY